MNRESNTEEIANSGLVPQLGMMARALWAAPVRNTLFWLSGAVFLVIAVTAYGQIRLNNWNQPFYDALSRRDFEQFLLQLGVFGLIAGALLALNVAQRWLGETLKLRLRQGLVLDLIQNWMQPGRAFRLSQAGAMGVNPDQRMHEDARHLTELAATGRLVSGITNLAWITAGYGWFTLVAPILVAAPLYFAGNISFGGLMMASGAFIQVQSSLRWFVDNFSTIADWRATLLRVASFRRAVLNTDILHGIESRITFHDGPSDAFTIENQIGRAHV